MSGNGFASTPKPPYYAVIFSSQQAEYDPAYETTAERMVELASTMPGFLGIESTRDTSGFGITVSYWRDEEAIRNWRQNAEHVNARRQGREKWYAHFELRIAKVERAYGIDRSAFAGKQEEETT